MIKNGDGSYTPSKTFLETFLSKSPEFQSPKIPNVDMTAFDPPLDSSDVGPDEWELIVSTLEKFYKNYHGFVIVHGTGKK